VQSSSVKLTPDRYRSSDHIYKNYTNIS